MHETPAAPSPCITSALIDAVRAQYQLGWNGIHGAPHWARVHANGLRLAALTGAKRDVVELFAYLHDACRLNDGRDPRHGERAARFAESLAGSVFKLAREDLALLVTACEGHTHGQTTGDITVLTCWDADRLDLGRVGIMPRASRLCTEAARDPEMIAWAYKRCLM